MKAGGGGIGIPLKAGLDDIGTAPHAAIHGGELRTDPDAGLPLIIAGSATAGAAGVVALIGEGGGYSHPVSGRLLAGSMATFGVGLTLWGSSALYKDRIISRNLDQAGFITIGGSFALGGGALVTSAMEDSDLGTTGRALSIAGGATLIGAGAVMAWFSPKLAEIGTRTRVIPTDGGAVVGYAGEY